MPPDPRELLPLAAVDFQVLLALVDGPRHAYGLATAVEVAPAGSVRLEIGSLYRVLARLTSLRVIEEDEHAGSRRAAAHEACRRYFRLTPFGRRVLQAEITRLEHVVHAARRRLPASPKSGT